MSDTIYANSPRVGGQIRALRDELLVSGLPLNIHSETYSNSIQVKTGPGMLFGLLVYNSKTAAQAIQIFDAASLPADGAVPAAVFNVPTVDSRALQYLPLGRVFLVGCVICNSSTYPTKTIGSADCFFDVQFI